MSRDLVTEEQWGPVVVRSTPWDAAVLDLATAEFRVTGTPPAEDLKAGLRCAIDSGKYDLLYGRVSPSAAVAGVLLATGFFACETQILFAMSERKFRAAGSGLAPRLAAAMAGDKDYKAAIDAARGLFQYSRFHEDPLISNDRAEARMRAWVGDLARRKTPLLVAYSSAGRMIGFMFCKTGPDAELILGGCTSEASFLAPRFWGGVVDFLFAQGARTIRAGVSAANVPMLRVYVELGFNVVSTGFDYHWHRLRRNESLNCSDT